MAVEGKPVDRDPDRYPARAVVAFPDEPLIPLARVIDPLREPPLLSVVSRLLLAIRGRGWWPTVERSAMGPD